MARVRSWQSLAGQGDLCAHAPLAGVLDPGGAPSAASQCRHDRQAEPGAVASTASPIEPLERAVGQLGVDWPGLAEHGQPARAVDAAGLDGHGRAAWRVLEGVLDQVVENRRELRLPGEDDTAPVLMEQDLVAALVGRTAPALGRIP